MPITELVEVKVKENISDEKFIKTADDFVKNCFMNVEGFIDSELFKENETDWKFIYHWESIESFESAGKSMISSEEAAKIKGMVDETKISTFEQICIWKQN